MTVEDRLRELLDMGILDSKVPKSDKSKEEFKQLIFKEVVGRKITQEEQEKLLKNEEIRFALKQVLSNCIQYKLKKEIDSDELFKKGGRT